VAPTLLLRRATPLGSPPRLDEDSDMDIPEEYMQCHEQKMLHVRYRKSHDHDHPTKGICLRCLQRGLLPRTTQVVRVGGGYLVLDEEGNSLLLGTIRPKTKTGSKLRIGGTDITLKKLAVKEVLADGTIVLEDGTRILPDGTRVLPDGTRILADGTILDKDGNVIGKLDPNMSLEDMMQKILGMQDGNFRGRHGSLGSRDGMSAAQRRASAARRDSMRSARDEESDSDVSDTDSEEERRRSAAANGSANGRTPSGPGQKDLDWSYDQEVVEILPDGTRVLKDGTRINPDGSMTLADGTVIPADVARKLAMERKMPPRRSGESEADYQARLRAMGFGSGLGPGSAGVGAHGSGRGGLGVGLDGSDYADSASAHRSGKSSAYYQRSHSWGHKNSEASAFMRR